ncbi:MarR family transcriptional regulator [Siminovitchia sp. FSL W7-1587]|uniref:MarR family winged helix-turn-helix transcriptional regulator n=1 Tax=Siminovitchia sp. FSL W7-1587 TaxID=2954699 RepID=UPI0030D16085
MEKYREIEKFRYLILAAQRQGNKILMELLREIGVTPSQAEVIRILGEKEFLTLKELGQLLICEDGSPSRLVERMVKEGLIRREKDKNDARFIRMTLSPLGKEKHLLITKAEEQMYRKMTQLYTTKEIELANRVLSKLLLDTKFEYKFEQRGFSLHHNHERN